MSFLGRLFHRGGMADYRQGIVAFNQGDYEQAAALFERTLLTIQDSSDPYYSLGRFYAAEAHCKLGLALYHARDPERAAIEFRKAIACGYKYPDLHAHLSGVFDRLGNAEAAEKEARTALEMHPEYHDARMRLAVALLSQGRPEASEELTRLRDAGVPLPEAPHQSDPAAQTATMLLQLREHIDSRQISRWKYLQGLESYERGDKARAVEELTRAVAEEPRYADLRCRLGSLLLEAGRVDDALAQLEVALEINPNYVEARLQAGLACLRRGEPRKAVDHLQAASERQPGYPDVQLFYGLALLREGRPDEAARALEKILSAVPSFGRAHYALGLVRLVQERTDEALHALRRAVECDSSLFRARADLGFLQIRRGEPEVAAALFKQVLERLPRDRESLLGLGVAQAACGQLDEAQTALQSAWDLDPTCLKTLDALCRVELRLGMHQDVGRRIDAALSRMPGSVNLHVLRGQAWAGVHEYPQAKQAFEAALAQDGHNVEARVGLGLALFAMARRPEGRAEMANALAADPTHLIARAFADERLVMEL